MFLGTRGLLITALTYGLLSLFQVFLGTRGLLVAALSYGLLFF